MAAWAGRRSEERLLLLLDSLLLGMYRGGLTAPDFAPWLICAKPEEEPTVLSRVLRFCPA
jgi:hypothetical protein